MLNAATRSATPANTRSTVWKKPRNALSTSSRCSAVSWRPVIAGDVGRERGPQSRAPSRLVDAVGAATSTPVSAPGRPRSRCCASAVVNAVNVVPAMLSAVPKVAMPTTVTGTGCGTSTVVRLPTWSAPSSAAARSMTTSPAPVGARPATIRHGFSAGGGHPVGPGRRRPVAADAVAVGAEELRLALDEGRGRGDTVDARRRCRPATRGCCPARCRLRR